VYSGGDDLVVVGNHYALDYLVRIVKRANEFGINVASGAMVHDARLPIYLIWHDTEERLNRAKDMGRDESLVYLLDTGKSPVILNIDRVRDVVNYIEQRHAWAEELEGEGGEASRTLMYKVTTHLTRMYDLLWEMREVLRDERGSKDLTRLNELRRYLVREVINYVYLINRNSRNAQGILNELPRNLHPSNVASTLAPILRSQDNQQEALKALNGLLNDLGVIVARINLFRQLLEKQQTMPT
jgi:CRISPR-associated protein Csm1